VETQRSERPVTAKLSRRGFVAGSLGSMTALYSLDSAAHFRALALQEDDGPIIVGMTGDGSTLDPANWTNINERHFIPAMFDNLVAVDENLGLVPGLATEWEPSEDGLEWTFYLRDGVLFHDGTEFDAEAVAFNIRWVLDENNALRHRADISMVTDVEVVDSLTVKFLLDSPFAPLPATLYESVGYISSPAALEEFGEDYGSNPVGTGPFKLVEWRRDNQLVLERFEDYWQDDLPRASGVTFTPIPDTAVKLTNLRSGTIDLVDEIAAADVDSVEADDSLQVFTLAGSRWPMVRLNTIVEPFDNQLLRQAFTHAVPREGIVQAIYFGRAQPAYGPISPLYSSIYDPEIEQAALAYDLDLARLKLEEAGIPDGFSFTLDIGSTPQTARMAELIQSSVAEVGIQMDIQPQESAAFTERLRSKQFQGALGSWTPRPDVDGTIYQHFHTDGLANWVSYSNPEVDDLLDQTRTAPLGEERNELFRQAERIIANDAPWAFIVFEELARAARIVVSGYEMTPDTLLHLGSVEKG
jgi:peptide/nickel transport system substrate-binding protein